MVADKAGLSTITENPFDVEKVRRDLLANFYGSQITEIVLAL